MSRSDERRFDDAITVCAASVALAEQARAARQQAWSLSMIGRVHLLRGELAEASRVLDRAADLVARERWTAFAPWVDALRAETLLECGRPEAAGERFEQAYALSLTLEDHCWIAMNARGLARVRFAAGDLEGALGWVGESVRRRPWYLWVHAYAPQTGVAVAHAAGDARARQWERELTAVTGRAQLWEFADTRPTRQGGRS